MNKREADTILLACKKHGISLSMSKEGSVYFVVFINRIEIRNFASAKHITNGLVVEGKSKRDLKKQVHSKQSPPKLNFSNYPTRKTRPENGITFAERHDDNID